MRASAIAPGKRRDPKANLRSEPGVDVFRAVVVVMMFAVHVRRLQSHHGSGFGDRLLSALMWAEPFIAAAFLMLVGVSLVLSWRRTQDDRSWLRRMLVRALGLYAISVALFVLQYGWALPDLLLSSGILSAIALAICVTSAVLRTRAKAVWLGLLAALSPAMAWLLELKGLHFSGLNAGPGGVVPIIGFAFWGALVMLWGRQRPVMLWVGGVAMALTAFAYFSRQPWSLTLASHYDDFGGELAALGLIGLAQPEGVKTTLFWNHSAVGFLGLSLPLWIGLALAIMARQWTTGRIWLGVHWIGRHALAAYVAHLLLLGLLDAVSFGPKNAVQAWLIVGALVVFAALFGAWLERPMLRGQPASTPPA